MRLRYDLTLDEAVASEFRKLYRTRAARSWWWNDLVGGFLLSGFFAGGLIFLLVSGIGMVDRTMSFGFGVRLGIACVAGILAGCWHPFEQRRQLELRFRGLLREQHGNGPCRVEVELGREGLSLSADGSRSTTPWIKVESVERGRDFIDIHWCRGVGTLAIPDRAFESEEDRARFIGDVKRFIDESRAAAGSGWAGVPDSEGIKAPAGVTERAGSAMPPMPSACCEAMRGGAAGLRGLQPTLRYCPWCGSARGHTSPTVPVSGEA